MARTYTDAEKQAAVALYETDGPSAVQRQLNIPKNTVVRWAKKAGVRSVRNEKNAAAVEAKKNDSKALRAELSRDALGVAKEAQLVILEMIANCDGLSIRDLATVYGIFIDKHLAFHRLDTDNGATEAKAMLERLAEQLKEPYAGSDERKAD